MEPQSRLPYCEMGITNLLLLLGEDPTRDGLKDTPKRVIKALQEMTSGYQEDPAEILSRQFDVQYDELVVCKDISFVSLCEHHMLPFTGTAAVGYIQKEGGKVVGLSKLARLVLCFAKRFQVQERLTQQIALALMEHLQCEGCGVLINAAHSCMSCRGVMQPNSKMVTSSLLGVFREDPKVRSEFLSLVR